jgi:hypothetical protein
MSFPKPGKLFVIELILAKHIYIYQELDVYQINSKGKIDVETIFMDKGMLANLNVEIRNYEKEYNMKFLDANNRNLDFLFINKKAISKVYPFKDGENTISDIHLSLYGQAMRVMSTMHPDQVNDLIKLESTI